MVGVWRVFLSSAFVYAYPGQVVYPCEVNRSSEQPISKRSFVEFVSFNCTSSAHRGNTFDIIRFHTAGVTWTCKV